MWSLKDSFSWFSNVWLAKRVVKFRTIYHSKLCHQHSKLCHWSGCLVLWQAFCSQQRDWLIGSVNSVPSGGMVVWHWIEHWTNLMYLSDLSWNSKSDAIYSGSFAKGPKPAHRIPKLIHPSKSKYFARFVNYNIAADNRLLYMYILSANYYFFLLLFSWESHVLFHIPTSDRSMGET